MSPDDDDRVRLRVRATPPYAGTKRDVIFARRSVDRYYNGREWSPRE